MKPYSILDNLIFLDIENADIHNGIDAVKIKDKVVTRFNTQDLVELLIFMEDLPLVCHDPLYAESTLNKRIEYLDYVELFAILFPEFTEFNFQYLSKKIIPHYIKGNSDVEDIINLINYGISNFFYENGYSLPMNLVELEVWNWYKYLTKVNMDDVKAFIDIKPKTFEDKLSEPYPVFALKDYEKLFEHKELWRRNGNSYTLRNQQKDASKFIREGLEASKITIMEAPTGLGKSLAYLLPSAIYAHLKNEKVIISTNTKGLQNQLVEKDIPKLLQVLNLKGDVSYTLIKGKSNYLCYDRFRDIEYPKDIKTLLGYVYLKLLIEKGIGEIEEIDLQLNGKFNLSYLIENCYCDSELCDVESCKYKDKCYYASKVEALKEAQLIVINHALLLKWPYKNIAPLENMVVDEAHNLSDEVYEAFESTMISFEFEKFLMDIYNSKEQSGFLYYLSRKTKKDTLPLSDIDLEIQQCNNKVKNIKVAFENYVTISGISREYNIKEHLVKENPKLYRVLEYLEYLKVDISNLNLSLDKAISVLKEIETIEKDKRFKILIEKVEIMNSYIMLLEEMILQSNEGYCHYFEVDKFFKWWKISSIPLDVSSFFYEKVLSGAKSCLFISATLSTDNSYDSLKNTLGINIVKSQNKELVEVTPIKPVFDYKGKSAIYAMGDMDPNNIDTFSGELKEFVLDLLNNVEGNIIMLFTSRKRLMAFKEVAVENLESLGVKVVDGKKDIDKLKSREGRYILLGSKGYFEGIDIPGDTMTTVILDKVPNINAKEPFYKSLIDNQVEKGKNYWQSYAKVNFPVVSIDLKQIYGRIIRTEYDYGSLFIMSKFHSDNSTVKKLATQLHGVPIIRKHGEEVFKDLKARVTRWKQINLYKIMKEVKTSLNKAISEKKKTEEIVAPKQVETFINEFMSLEYSKRKLKYDVNISVTQEVSICINGESVKLEGVNKKNINQYFNDIV